MKCFHLTNHYKWLNYNVFLVQTPHAMLSWQREKYEEKGIYQGFPVLMLWPHAIYAAKNIFIEKLFKICGIPCWLRLCEVVYFDRIEGGHVIVQIGVMKVKVSSVVAFIVRGILLGKLKIILVRNVCEKWKVVRIFWGK